MPPFATDFFSEGQSLAAGTDTGLVSSFCKELNGRKRLGVGEPVFIQSVLGSALTGSGKDLDVHLAFGDDEADFTASPTLGPVVSHFDALSAAGTEKIGVIPDVFVPAGSTVFGLVYKGPNGAVTGGTITSELTLEPGRDVVVPRGDVVG